MTAWERLEAWLTADKHHSVELRLTLLKPGEFIAIFSGDEFTYSEIRPTPESAVTAALNTSGAK